MTYWGWRLNMDDNGTISCYGDKEIGGPGYGEGCFTENRVRFFKDDKTFRSERVYREYAFKAYMNGDGRWQYGTETRDKEGYATLADLVKRYKGTCVIQWWMGLDLSNDYVLNDKSTPRLSFPWRF